MCVYNEYYLTIKRIKFYFCAMDGPQGHYATWNKLGREGQLPYDLTYLWYLKTKQKPKKQTYVYREHIGGSQR